MERNQQCQPLKMHALRPNALEKKQNTENHLRINDDGIRVASRQRRPCSVLHLVIQSKISSNRIEPNREREREGKEIMPAQNSGETFQFNASHTLNCEWNVKLFFSRSLSARLMFDSRIIKKNAHALPECGVLYRPVKSEHSEHQRRIHRKIFFIPKD